MMSADNGIYIANFANYEWRVIEAGNIENLEYEPDTDDGYNSNEVVRYYKKAESFATEYDADSWAAELERKNSEEDFGILEHGVCCLVFEHPFGYYAEQSKTRRKRK